MILVPDSLDSHSLLSCGCLMQKAVEERVRGKPGWLQGSLSSLLHSLPLGDGSRQREQQTQRSRNEREHSMFRELQAESSSSLAYLSIQFIQPTCITVGQALTGHRAVNQPRQIQRAGLTFFFLQFFKFLLFIFGWVGSSHCCMLVFSGCGKRGYSLVEVRGLLIAVASVVAELRL